MRLMREGGPGAAAAAAAADETHERGVRLVYWKFHWNLNAFVAGWHSATPKVC